MLRLLLSSLKFLHALETSPSHHILTINSVRSKYFKLGHSYFLIFNFFKKINFNFDILNRSEMLQLVVKANAKLLFSINLNSILVKRENWNSFLNLKLGKTHSLREILGNFCLVTISIKDSLLLETDKNNSTWYN